MQTFKIEYIKTKYESMKKILLILLTSICVISCTKTGYSIEGKASMNELNGKTIFIKERINREWISIDSAIVENGKFHFEGKSDSAKMAYLTYEISAENHARQAFVLENGKISASIDSTGFMTICGTPENDKLQIYQNAKNVVLSKEEHLYNSHSNIERTPESEKMFLTEMDKLNKEEIEIDKKYSTENVNTLIGSHIFMNSFYEMSVPEKEAIVSLMNAKTKQIQRISEIIADIATEKKTAVGNQYTNFKLPALTGDSIALSDLVGKTDYVMIDFWASWCGPCMRSLPDLKTLYSKYEGTRFQILGVSLDDDHTAWADAVSGHNLKWKMVSDLKGWKCEGSRIYAVNSIPSTVLIDKTGKIVGRNLSIDEMDKLLSEKGLK